MSSHPSWFLRRSVSAPGIMLLLSGLLAACGPLPPGTGTAPVVQGATGPATPDPAADNSMGPNGANGGMGGGGGVTAGGGVALP